MCSERVKRCLKQGGAEPDEERRVPVPRTQVMVDQAVLASMIPFFPTTCAVRPGTGCTLCFTVEELDLPQLAWQASMSCDWKLGSVVVLHGAHVCWILRL